MKNVTNFTLGLLVLFLYFSAGKGLLCYRCDSQYSEDCLYYPAPMSSFENCNEKPHRTYSEYRGTKLVEELSKDEPTQQPIYIRYRYKLCPLMEKTIKQYVSFADYCNEQDGSRRQPIRTPSPMEGVNFVCGKAVTHGPNGVRVRRGCTPDPFLNGTNGCVSHSPHGYEQNSIACFCNTDFCNHGSSLTFPQYKLFWLNISPFFTIVHYFLYTN